MLLPIFWALKTGIKSLNFSKANNLGFGSNLKVFLIYDKPFWQGNFSEEDSSVIVPLYIQDCGQKTLVSEYLHSAEPLAWNKNVILCRNI